MYCSTHWPHMLQISISRCLKMQQSKIYLSVKRLGGSYGMKLSRSSQVACACALASHLTRQPVRFVMSIESSMTTIGKRYGCVAEYDAIVDAASGRW